ncbi:MAG TPA: isopentenyl-diphosphate Delta-isomerase [Chitinophagaceae bacterium]|jgi:isopentenyl-diphosphate delta-isomerase|nr:isopentenyl-diphosphate Delta-isomerase [Chitinophagaceae bacterium]
MEEQPIILVNEQDQPVGTMDKLSVHQQGLLHRAFSVFVFDRAGRLLLQQRAQRKYHGGGLWTNTCCSHPYPGEATDKAAARRLQEEMGFQTPLRKLFHFTYHAAVENGLIEHEFDHVFAGEYEGPVAPDGSEVADYCYREMEAIENDLQQNPARYTTWFRLAFPALQEWWQGAYKPKEVQ